MRFCVENQRFFSQKTIDKCPATVYYNTNLPDKWDNKVVNREKGENSYVKDIQIGR